jgi:serine phosphatase RsbU (regulator of sigma subunit)
MILIAYQLLIITGVITQPLFGIRMVYVYGIVFLAVTVSINLSKKVSDTNIDLEKQLVHVKELSQKAIEQERKAKEIEFTRRLLEADNERKTRELEEARKLQISMLPANVPAVLNLDISVYMKPATEVGGDYYDFKYNNGSLFIAVGDATGHGMKAGTIVATIKGLFTAESFNSEIVQFMDKTNEVIRDMNMGNLFMAFLIAKINENKLTLSSAGMPPALLYSSKKKNVEEIRLQALPLGGTAGFKYSQLEIPIFPGDTLLLMSDGFPELFNEQKEILDYQPAKEIFTSVADLAPDKIVNELCLAADNWRGNANQEDDITFVVVKLKEK